MLTDYAESEANVLLSEGGYTNNPSDPGGPTNWGITIYDARLYWKHDATAADVRAMPKSVAQQIYKKKYWDALDCDQLPAGLDYSVFDYGVNSGIGRPGKVLRTLVGLPVTDWHITADVIAAVGKRDCAALINSMNDERLAFLKRLGTWGTFGTGWSRRVASVRTISLAMNKRGARVSAPPVPIPQPPPQPVAKGVDHPNDLAPPTAGPPQPTARGIVYISYGLGGASIELWNTGLRQLITRCKAAGFDTRNSPYEWNQYNVIIDDINSHTPADAPIAAGGASLGDDYATAIGARARRKIAYLFGFQDSTWAPTLPVTGNVLVADNIYNPSWWQTWGFGSGQWTLAAGNTVTKLRNIPIYAPHPDDWGVAQDIVFAQIHKLLVGSA